MRRLAGGTVAHPYSVARQQSLAACTQHDSFDPSAMAGAALLGDGMSPRAPLGAPGVASRSSNLSDVHSVLQVPSSS